MCDDDDVNGDADGDGDGNGAGDGVDCILAVFLITCVANGATTSRMLLEWGTASLVSALYCCGAEPRAPVASA